MHPHCNSSKTILLHNTPAPDWWVLVQGSSGHSLKFSTLAVALSVSQEPWADCDVTPK